VNFILFIYLPLPSSRIGNDPNSPEMNGTMPSTFYLLFFSKQSTYIMNPACIETKHKDFSNCSDAFESVTAGLDRDLDILGFDLLALVQ
jgi:hypothetical protein